MTSRRTLWSVGLADTVVSLYIASLIRLLAEVGMALYKLYMGFSKEWFYPYASTYYNCIIVINLPLFVDRENREDILKYS